MGHLVDVTGAIITALFERLRDDTSLAALMGEAWTGPHARLPEDTPFPYIHHRLASLEGADNATRPATYTVEIWDWGENQQRLWAIRGRLMALLDMARVNVPGQGVLRLWFASETPLPNADRNVLTTALVFSARYARAGEVRNITQEKGTP